MKPAHPTTDYNPAIRHTRLGRGEHRLETQTWFRLPVADVFPFFTDVENLERITPPELGFRIVTPTPVEIEQGTLFEYRLRLWGVPFGWHSRISVWDPPHRFADEQLRGPYHTWFHEHVFEAAQGGTRMTDRVTYRLPGHPLAGPLLPLVRRQLERIFRFRAATIAGLVVPSPGDRREL
ncbi:SRPBCC family protein [Lentisalinibacter sediminis]|uniref:SRPBCC family protein n=1 Tax=Lentisalinibacter sediminis TaxID=2992237 RepID=UPI00386E877C